MANIIRSLEQVAPSVAPKKGATPRGRTASLPKARHVVRISNKDIAEELVGARIQSIVVSETSRGLSRAEVVILNDNLRFTDVELLQGAFLDVEIWTGYEAAGLVKRGDFRAAVPKYSFRNSSMSTIKLVCFGEEWPLMVNERRRVWENHRDSEIVARIASEYGLAPDVDPTGAIYEHIAQFNMTDMEFLENRALLYGYSVFVEDGVLHFHAPRFEHSGLTMVFGQGEVGILNSFDVIVDPWVNGAAWTKSGIDRLTGKEWEFSSLPTDSDNVSRQIQGNSADGFISAPEIATLDGVRPRRFIVGEGHELTEAEGREQVGGFTRATEWLCQGSARVRGIETLKARQVVTLGGVGHMGGDYYVSKVRHSLVGSKPYSMQFEVIRPGTGRLLAPSFKGASLPSPGSSRNVTNASVQIGSAVLG